MRRWWISRRTRFTLTVKTGNRVVLRRRPVLSATYGSDWITATVKTIRSDARGASEAILPHRSILEVRRGKTLIVTGRLLVITWTRDTGLIKLEARRGLIE